MKVSLEWLLDCVDLPPDLSPNRIARDLTMTTVEVEGISDLGATLNGVVAGEVLEVHEADDQLREAHVVCDVGSKTVEIISGADNVRVGGTIAVSLTGMTAAPDADKGNSGAPDRAGHIDAPTIPSVHALGLELLLPDQHGSAAADLSELGLQAGQELAPAISWNDTVFEIDNKSLTNRPDLWGHYGIARELSAIYGKTLKPLPPFRYSPSGRRLIDEDKVDTSICNRYTATLIAGVRTGVSPLWLRSRLARVGQQAHGFFVDLTNYVMLAVGQPCHVFDAGKISLPIGVRYARRGESLRLLDDQVYELDEPIVVIADSERGIAAAGVKGGMDSRVTSSTTEVVLEAANFDALVTRRSCNHLGIRTEASARFEKSLDTNLVDSGLGLFLSILEEVQPSARVAAFSDFDPGATREQQISLDLQALRKRLGMRMQREEISRTLEAFGFTVSDKGESFDVTVPTWRATGDVSMPHDLLEEVARLYGYENFEYVEPRVGLRPVSVEARKPLARRLRETLASIGEMQEIVTYPWVDESFADAAGLKGAATLELVSPPAPDRKHLRSSLVPGLLEKVVANLRFGSSFRLFEIGSIFPGGAPRMLDNPSERLPPESVSIAGALVGADRQKLYTDAKGVLAKVARVCRLAEVFYDDSGTPLWAERNAHACVRLGGESIGFLGVLSRRARRIADVKRSHVVLFELSVNAIEKLGALEPRYHPLPEFPEVTVDISMLFPKSVLWSDIERTLEKLDRSLVREVTFVDQFSGNDIPPESKSITFRLRLGSDYRTLRSEEVAEVSRAAQTTLAQELGGSER